MNLKSLFPKICNLTCEQINVLSHDAIVTPHCFQVKIEHE